MRSGDGTVMEVRAALEPTSHRRVEARALEQKQDALELLRLLTVCFLLAVSVSSIDALA